MIFFSACISWQVHSDQPSTSSRWAKWVQHDLPGCSLPKRGLQWGRGSGVCPTYPQPLHDQEPNQAGEGGKEVPKSLWPGAEGPVVYPVQVEKGLCQIWQRGSHGSSLSRKHFLRLTCNCAQPQHIGCQPFDLTACRRVTPHGCPSQPQLPKSSGGKGN